MTDSYRLGINPSRFLGITADQDYGGLAMGYQAHCIVMEELSRGSGELFRPLLTRRMVH